MIVLPGDKLLYHGSYTEVKKIDLTKCRKGLDFGQGFYLTSSYEQAMRFVRNSTQRAKEYEIVNESYSVDDGRVSIFKFQKNPELSILIFNDADIEWLHFVASNRNDSLFPELKEKYSHVDIVGGKIANDKTAEVLNAYVTGLYGDPGIERTDRFVIESLMTNRLSDQFCFRTKKAIKALEFVRSDPYVRNESKHSK